MPTANGRPGSRLAQPPTTITAPSGSYRLKTVKSTSSSRPASAATAANTSSGGAARATSVATRRSAACSSAKPRSSRRAWVLAIAVATSSVKPASRVSVSAGSGSTDMEPTIITPHSRPSTLIGAPTEAPNPRRRAKSAAGPEASQ